MVVCNRCFHYWKVCVFRNRDMKCNLIDDETQAYVDIVCGKDGV